MNIATFNHSAKRTNIFTAINLAKHYGISAIVIKAWTTAVLATFKK